MTGELERLLAVESPAVFGGGDAGIRIIGLGLAQRHDQARRALLEMRRAALLPLFQSWGDYLTAWLDRRPADMHTAISALGQFKIQDDPEAIFLEGWLLCDVGELEQGLAHLRRAVARGYFVAATLSDSRAFDPLRSVPAFQALLLEAEAGHQRTLAAFREAGGEQLLGR
jgi:hypothetical protein